MARKAYSDEERAQVKETLMVTMIRCIADRGLIHSSIDVLCRKVGISKTFFYSFFSSKEELVLHALRYQQPKLLDYIRLYLHPRLGSIPLNKVTTSDIQQMCTWMMTEARVDQKNGEGGLSDSQVINCYSLCDRVLEKRWQKS